MESMSPADGETVEVLEGVHLTQLVRGDRMNIQHYHIEPGARVPEHSHDNEQTGYVDAGALTFEVDSETHVIGAGESFVIPGGEPHAAENCSDVPVSGIDVFSPPRAPPSFEG